MTLRMQDDTKQVKVYKVEESQGESQPPSLSLIKDLDEKQNFMAQTLADKLAQDRAGALHYSWGTNESGGHTLLWFTS